jgi:hypothetical protein
VSIGLVNEFLAGPAPPANEEARAAASRYRDARQARIAELRRTFDRPWGRVTDAAFRSCLSQAAATVQGK